MQKTAAHIERGKQMSDFKIRHIVARAHALLQSVIKQRDEIDG